MYLTKNQVGLNEICCVYDYHNYMSNMCERSYWQNIDFSRNCLYACTSVLDERINCDLANACDGVLPLISRELEGIFLGKCKGPRRG